MEIKNLNKVANRILKAIKKKEKIVLYADSDLDGISSAIILKETIKNLKGEVTEVFFPDREKEGYGISSKKIKPVKEKKRILFIALDLGISSFKEVEKIKKMGYEVIIIDHHEILDKLPSASIIVDPKQKGDKYPFKGLATAGIVFRLAKLLLKNKITPALENNFLELVLLATLYDRMPEEEDNKFFIEKGLSILNESWRPGLRVFLDSPDFQGFLTNREKAQKIVSILSAAGFQNNLLESYLLLTSNSLKEAQSLANTLLEKACQRQKRIREIFQEVEKISIRKINEPIIFEGSEDWSLSLIGPVASKLCNLFQKPTFLFRKGEKESQGSVRTPVGIDSVVLMKKCQKILLSFGGHPQAAGFRIKNQNLEKFKDCLILNFQKGED